MVKKQWKIVDLSLKFLAKIDVSQKETDNSLDDVNSIRSALPTITNAARQIAELDNIPETGPFILKYANVSFEASETAIRNLFVAFDVVAIELNSNRRGCGHIEFKSIVDLSGALKMNGKIFLNRPLVLSIPLKNDMDNQISMGKRPGCQSQQKSSAFDAEDSDNWRVKKPQMSSEKKEIEGNKADKSSNWRSGVVVNDKVTAVNPIEETNWRCQSNQRSKENGNIVQSCESNTWRKISPQNDEAKTKENTTWRKSSHTNLDSKTNSVINENNSWRNRTTRDNNTKTEVSTASNASWRNQTRQEDNKPSDMSNWRTNVARVTDDPRKCYVPQIHSQLLRRNESEEKRKTNIDDITNWRNQGKN
jgi:hypothetical protein